MLCIYMIGNIGFIIKEVRRPFNNRVPLLIFQDIIRISANGWKLDLGLYYGVRVTRCGPDINDYDQ